MGTTGTREVGGGASATAAVAPRDVLEFWLGPRGDEGPEPERVARWFTRDDALDREIDERFGVAVAHAIEGGFEAWRGSSPDWLALVVLLDQFPRNLHRDDPRAFAGDARALAIVRAASDERLAALHPLELYFALVPWMHSEALADQRAGEAAFERWATRVAPAFVPLFENGARYATRHRVVIERFGRFPHRNAVLGRESSDAECAFLEANPEGF